MNLAMTAAVGEDNTLVSTQLVALSLITTIQFRQVPFLEMLMMLMCYLENNINSSVIYSSFYSC